MELDGAQGVLAQPMINGQELFVGLKKEVGYVHLIMCGAGGVLIEVLKDYTVALAPVSKSTALAMIQRLKSYPLFKGVRNIPAINEDAFADIIVALSDLVDNYPQIEELDINPLKASGDKIIAVDARIKME